MAINPETLFAGKITPSSPAFPYGQARNITLPGDGTGTPFEAALVNDIFGFQQSLLSAASIVPSGTPDEVGASQYLEAMNVITALALAGANPSTRASAVANADLILGQTRTLTDRGNGAFEVIIAGTTAGVDLPDGLGILQCTGVPTFALRVIATDWFVLPEWYGAVPTTNLTPPTVDSAPAINAAKATRKVAILQPNKIYGVDSSIKIESKQKLRGGHRGYINDGAIIQWIGAATPPLAVVYMIAGDSIAVEEATSTSGAEFSNIIVNGGGVANIGFIASFISNGTVVERIFCTDTLQEGAIFVKCFYVIIDRITARNNQGRGVSFGGSPLIPYVGDKACNGLGDVNVEGHSNGKDLTWDPTSNSSAGYGLGLFGTIHKTRFVVTLEANEGSALHENVQNGEFDVYGYIESSAKNHATPGLYSIHLLGSTSVLDKCSINVVLRKDQNVVIRTSGGNTRFYNLELHGSDTGTGITDNGHTFYQIDPKSRFTFTNLAPAVTMFETILAEGEVNLNLSSGFTQAVYANGTRSLTLRIIQRVATVNPLNFNYSVTVDGVLTTSKAINVDNKSAFEVTESNIGGFSGLIELQGTQSIGTLVLAYYQIIARDVINHVQR